MIGTLSAYLFSLRLSGVLEVVTSVGQRDSTLVGNGFVGRVCVFGIWRWGTNISRTVVSSCLARGYPGLLVVVVCVAGAGWSRRSLLYSLAFVGLAVGGFLNILAFSAPFFFGFVSFDFLSPLGPGGVGGNTAGGRLSQVGFGSRCCGGSPLFPVLS